MALYAKIDVAFPDDPKVIDAGDLAELVYLRCVLRSREYLTDGFIDRRVISRWCVGIRGRLAVHFARLVEVGLLLEAEGGWQIPEHAWRRWNPTASEVDDKRAEEAERKRLYRETKKSQRDNPGSPNGTPVGVRAASGLRDRQPEPEPEPEPEPCIPAAIADATTAAGEANRLAKLAFSQPKQPVLRSDGKPFPAVQSLFKQLLTAGRSFDELEQVVGANAIDVWTIAGIQVALAKHGHRATTVTADEDWMKAR